MRGQVIFYPTVPMRDVDTGVQYSSSTGLICNLDADGSFLVDLPVTDSLEWEPVGWDGEGFQWVVQENVPGGMIYAINLPYATTVAVLSDLPHLPII